MFTGILPVAKDEEGLASVISHGKYDSIIVLTRLTFSPRDCSRRLVGDPHPVHSER